MCTYCGCRNIEAIAKLTAEHEQIENLVGEVRRCSQAGQPEAALDQLHELDRVLGVHDAVEELTVYRALHAHPEYADKVDILFEEHDDVHEAIEMAFRTARSDGATAVRFEPLLAVLDRLWHHIEHEENGMFPAAAIELSIEEWDKADEVRAQVEPPHSDNG